MAGMGSKSPPLHQYSMIIVWIAFEKWRRYAAFCLLWHVAIAHLTIDLWTVRLLSAKIYIAIDAVSPQQPISIKSFQALNLFRSVRIKEHSALNSNKFSYWFETYFLYTQPSQDHRSALNGEKRKKKPSRPRLSRLSHFRICHQLSKEEAKKKNRNECLTLTRRHWDRYASSIQ